MQTVTVEPDTANDGMFVAVFEPVATSFDSYSIKAESAGDTIVLTNILFGDVFICSGQSNMQFTVDQAFNATNEVSNASRYDNIRVFTAPETCSNTSLDELLYVEEIWSVAGSKSIGGGNWSYFSATCWFFGRNLYDTLQYPIGLIGTDYGGTPVRDWIPKPYLSICNETSMDVHKRRIKPGLKDLGGLTPSCLYNGI